MLALAAMFLAPLGHAFAQTDAVSREDKEFFKNAGELNMTEISLGRMAQEKAFSPEIKALGATLETDHAAMTADLAALEENTAPKALSTEDLNAFFEENLDRKIEAIVADVQVLSAIAEGNIETKTFDFDGRKFEKERANEVIAQLAKEKAAAEKHANFE